MFNSDIIKNNFPFMTSITHGGIEYICVIQNVDDKFITLYDVSMIHDDHMEHFIDCCQSWWYESNRKIPISIFIGDEMLKFRESIKVIPIRNTDFNYGPVTSLSDLMTKRIKRKQISVRDH